MSVMIEDLGLLPATYQNKELSSTKNDHLLRGVIQHAGLTVSVVSFGASVQNVRLQANNTPLVLGFKDPFDYLQNSSYLGAMVGRCANRITHGKAELGDQRLHLTRHEGQSHHLHGGPEGSSARNWSMETIDNGLVLRDRLPNGHMGYSGNLTVEVKLTVGALHDVAYEHFVSNATKGAGAASGAFLDVQITATTDVITLCNFTPHWYFNLDQINLGQKNLRQHQLEINADSYLVTDSLGIPEHTPRKLANDVRDCRAYVPLSDDLLNVLDHNYCLQNPQQRLQTAAKLLCQDSQMMLTLLTNQVGLQVYGGKGLNIPAEQTLTGRAYQPLSGIALEPQGWPDAPNKPSFPSILLNPADTYFHHDRYEFQLG